MLEKNVFRLRVAKNVISQSDTSEQVSGAIKAIDTIASNDTHIPLIFPSTLHIHPLSKKANTM
jgi:hypothetical protein